MRALSALAAAALALAAPAFAQDRSSPLPDHLPLGQEACFSYSFDRDELREKPRQRVTSITLFRDFTPDELSEETPRSADEMRKDDGDGSGISITAMLSMRGSQSAFANTLYCSKGKSGVRCGVECDGGDFLLKPDKDGLIVENQGFLVHGGCGDPEKSVLLDPKPDDRRFRVEPKPVDLCHQLRDLRRPAYAKSGTPLRVRLAGTDPVCFSREYDAKHLAGHPQQTVKRIAVLKAAGKGDDTLRELTFRVELKNGRKLERKTTCYGSKYALACTHHPDFDTSQDFFLTRAGDDQIMLRDAKGKLAELFKAKLGSDDRTFRLSAAPESACRF